jgi:hypothetical protein
MVSCQKICWLKQPNEPSAKPGELDKEDKRALLTNYDLALLG